jgi:superfamily II DNA helicase RecQ
VRDGLVVVISPLVALMEDQVLALQKRGITAACLHAGLDPGRRQQAMARLRDESLRLLYIAPERLQGEATRQMLENHASEGRLVALAVDEAHCISAWGHDFRPDYRRLGMIRRLCPGVPMLALSATAAPRVRADILRLLDLRSPLVQVSSARRANLNYTMQRRPRDPMPQVLEALGAIARGCSDLCPDPSFRRALGRAAEGAQGGCHAVPRRIGPRNPADGLDTVLGAGTSRACGNCGLWYGGGPWRRGSGAPSGSSCDS